MPARYESAFFLCISLAVCEIIFIYAIRNYCKYNYCKLNKKINSRYSNPFVLGKDIPDALFCDGDEETRMFLKQH